MSYIGQGLPADTFQGFTTDKFTGDGTANKTFTLTKEPFSEDTILVTIDGVVQEPTDDFTVSGTTLTLVGTAPNNSEVNVTHMGGPLPIGGAAELDLNGASDKLVLDADADTTISADTDDQIDFKAGGTDIMSLTATTATFNDGVTISVADNSDNLTLTSTDADANAGPNLRLYRNSSSPADHDIVGQIDFEGRNDNSEDIVYAKIFGSPKDVSDGTEDGGFFIHTMLAGSDVSRMGMSSSQTVFNDDGNNIDFRVEGDGDTYLIFAGATGADNNDRVYLGYYTGADVTDATMIFSTDRNEEVTKIFASNGSYAEDVIHGDCTRAGTSAYNLIRMTSNGNNDSELILDGAGALAIDGTLTESGADYAEFFEWKDGNSSSEDRVGYSVVLDGNKIVKATDSDDASKIIGVISGSPAVVGDGDIERWRQKYLTDDYGREIYEEYTITEWEEEQTNVKGDKNMVTVFYETDKIPDDVTPPADAVIKSTELDGVTKLKRRKLNSSWDSSQTYVSRKDRKEWDTVGLMGKLRLRKGQPTGTNWIKMRDISDTVEEWLIR